MSPLKYNHVPAVKPKTFVKLCSQYFKKRKKKSKWKIEAAGPKIEISAVSAPLMISSSCRLWVWGDCAGFFTGEFTVNPMYIVSARVATVVQGYFALWCREGLQEMAGLCLERISRGIRQ